MIKPPAYNSKCLSYPTFHVFFFMRNPFKIGWFGYVSPNLAIRNSRAPVSLSRSKEAIGLIGSPKTSVSSRAYFMLSYVKSVVKSMPSRNLCYIRAFMSLVVPIAPNLSLGTIWSSLSIKSLASLSIGSFGHWIFLPVMSGAT